MAESSCYQYSTHLNEMQNAPIWRIGLYERREFRNGKVGALCLECGQLFWDTGDGEMHGTGGIERELKKHVLAAHRGYGLKLLELMLEREEDEEEGQQKEEQCTKAEDLNINTTASTVSSTSHSHSEANNHSFVPPSAEKETPQHQLQKRQFPPNTDDNFTQTNLRDRLSKELRLAHADSDGGTSTDCDGTTILSGTTPPVPADLLAAAEQLCASLHNNCANKKMPTLVKLLNVPTAAPLAVVDDANRTEQICIELPELPARVFPVYVDEHTERWHWLHSANNELQATRTYDKRLVTSEPERLFFGCASDQLCSFRAVWVRDRLAVYQKEKHTHPLQSSSLHGLTNYTDPINSPITASSSDHSRIPIDELITTTTPIVINVSAASHIAKNDKRMGRPSPAEKGKRTEQWKLLARIDENEANLASICSKWMIHRQGSAKNGGLAPRFHYGCKRQKPPFSCKFRALYISGQKEFYFRGEHNHCVPLNAQECALLKEWNVEQQKVKKQQRLSEMSFDVQQFMADQQLFDVQQQYVSDQQYYAAAEQQSPANNHQIALDHSLPHCSLNDTRQQLGTAKQQQQRQQSSTQRNVICHQQNESSLISALQTFVSNLHSPQMPSTSQQQFTSSGAFHLNSQFDIGCADQLNISKPIHNVNGTSIKRE